MKSIGFHFSCRTEAQGRRLEYVMDLISRVLAVPVEMSREENARIIYGTTGSGAARGRGGQIVIPALDESDWNSECRHSFVDGLDIFHVGAPPEFVFEGHAFGFDLLYAVYASATGLAESRLPVNELGRLDVRDGETIGLARPVIHHLCGDLARRLRAVGEEIPTEPNRNWPFGRKMVMLLTHDIDEFAPEGLVDYPATLRRSRHHVKRSPVKGCALFLRGIIESLSESMTRTTPFDEWRNFEAEKGIRATWFLATRNRFQDCAHPWDVTYDARHSRITRGLRRLEEDGHEVGLHPSISAWRNPELLKREINILAELAQQPPAGVRHHFLALDPECPENTLALHAGLGLKYDLSFALRFILGYRRGLCIPFRPFHHELGKVLGIWSIPTQVMDCAMDPVMKTENLDRLIGIYQTVRELGGVLVLDYHNHTLAKEIRHDFQKHGETLRAFVNEINLSEIWTPTVSELVAHFDAVA